MLKIVVTTINKTYYKWQIQNRQQEQGCTFHCVCDAITLPTCTCPFKIRQGFKEIKSKYSTSRIIHLGLTTNILDKEVLHLSGCEQTTKCLYLCSVNTFPHCYTAKQQDYLSILSITSMAATQIEIIVLNCYHRITELYIHL